MDKIIARIQGETDFVSEAYSVSDLNALKDSRTNIDLLGAQMGTILDGHPTVPLTQAKIDKAKKLLASFVANTESYQRMLSERAPSILLTSLRVVRGRDTGYVTRIAGISRMDLDSLSIVVDPDEDKNLDASFLLLLQLMKNNPSYAKDGYDPKGYYSRLMQQAHAMGELQFVNVHDN